MASALLLVSIVQMWPSGETKARPVREVRRLGGLLQPRREPARGVSGTRQSLAWQKPG